MGTSPEAGEGKGLSDPQQDWLGRATTARSVAVAAAFVMAAGATVVVLTLVRERPIPGINTLLIPVVSLAVACGAWAAFAVRTGNPLTAPHPDRNATNFIKRFTHPAEWWGLPRRARLALAVVGVVSFIVAASSNPSLGEGNNNPSISVCSPGTSRAVTCVSYVLHQHALAARQRFCRGAHRRLLHLRVRRCSQHPTSGNLARRRC